MLIDAFWFVVVTAIGFAVLTVFQSRWTTSETAVLQLSLLAHGLMVGVNLYVATSVYGYGDMFMYHGLGSELAAGVRGDPRLLGVVSELVLHLETETSSVLTVGAGTTGAMIGLTSVMCLLTNDSFWGSAALFTLAGFFGKVLLFEGLRIAIPKRGTLLAVGATLVPSAVYWSAGIIKEAVATTGLGLAFLGVVIAVERGDRRTGAALFLLGAIPIYSVKPYILVALVLGAVAYAYARRASATGLVFRPVALAGAFVATLAAVYVIGLVVPRVSVDNLLDETARMQEAGVRNSSGSAYTLSSATSSSLGAQLRILPLALFTGLFRPGLWEAGNGLMVVNGLETLAFLAASVWAAWKLRVAGSIKLLKEYPVVGFLVVFVVVLGLATGATSSNLGTLSRYRMPLMPFFGCFLLLVARRRQP
jgi:hypothetical protein